MPLRMGLTAEFEIEVGAADTAIAVGSGDLSVLGTPRVVALLEAATVQAVATELAPQETTVGVEVAVKHLRASGIGAHVRATAELVEVDGKRLDFAVAAYESDTLIAEGTVRRVVVDRARFMERITR